MSINEYPYDLARFVHAQRRDYIIALDGLSQGAKYSHWMWYTFPQIDGLGHSYVVQKCSIRNIAEARAYFVHLVLGKRLIECCEVLLGLGEAYTASEIFGYPDDIKLKSSMTLFANISESNSIFHQIINRYFQGEMDNKTLEILKILK